MRTRRTVLHWLAEREPTWYLVPTLRIWSNSMRESAGNFQGRFCIHYRYIGFKFLFLKWGAGLDIEVITETEQDEQ